MCGIFCSIAYINDQGLNNKEIRVEELLNCRGPDTCHSLVSDVSSSNFIITMIGKTLWMQGNEPRKQPMESMYGALLFNGDVYDSERDRSISDTEKLMKNLDEKLGCGGFSENDVIKVMKNLIGPFSLIYWDKINNHLYFSRDRFGRKSLLICKENEKIILSSVLKKEFRNAVELPTGYIYLLDLNNSKIKQSSWLENLSDSKFQSVDDWFSSLNIEISNYYFTCTPMHEEDINFLSKVENLSINMSCRVTFLKTLLFEESLTRKVKKLLDLLSDSVKTRVSTQPGVCKNCVLKKAKCTSHCTLGILFSGGLDCTILAALAHRHVPIDESIDLLNVAFEHKSCVDFRVPDRLTSFQSLEELKKIFPLRKWNLVEVNVTTQELKEKQSDIIGDLVYPLQSILDESLGSALWFAARGETPNYKSTSRVLLMGMGADELFGGYTRHRNIFKRGGWTALERELQMDWQRLPYRNLARDDRVVSHHGRQPRMPYLDEKFIDFVVGLKPWERCFLNEKCGPGTGDKMLLRLAAMTLGLECASVLPKRAIQFGSKIANKKDNAKDISQTFTKILL